VQLLLNDGTPNGFALDMLASLAQEDPSPIVRLYLAAALQRLPLDARWPIIEKLVAHEEDADDQNLPLMIWYGLEPLVTADSARTAALLGKTKLPLVRKHIARRLVEK
jgi:hypothetical protein